MNQLDEYSLMKFMEYLNNEDLLNFLKTSKFLNNISNDVYFYNKIKYRYHPAVFNYADNFCLICNFKPIILTDFDLKFIRCSHY